MSTDSKELEQLLKDIDLAQEFLERELASPAERKARTTLSRVLKTICEIIEENLNPRDDPALADAVCILLDSLANALDPEGVPEIAKRVNTRKIVFEDAGPGANKSRATLANRVSRAGVAVPSHFGIAFEVQVLRKAGRKGAVGIVAEKYGNGQ
jgi:hypothetical protein